MHFVADSDNLATSLSFYVLLGDVFGLVVEEAMRVSSPSNASHVNFENGFFIEAMNFFKVFDLQSKRLLRRLRLDLLYFLMVFFLLLDLLI